MKTAIKILCIFALFATSSRVMAQEIFLPSQEKPGIVATQTKEYIKLDGRLTEADWAQAKAIDSFIQVEPLQGQPSANHTEVKILYDQKNLYVGVYCAEPNGRAGLRVPDLKRDFNWRAHDTFAICFDGFNDSRNSISIVTNPYGAQKDYLSFDNTFFDGDWNGLWSVRTTRTDSSWTAEFAIPWKTLRYSADDQDFSSWGINFLRLHRASNEISAWSPYPRSFGFNRMEFAGRVDSLRTPPPSANIQLNPYLLTAVRRSHSGEGNTEDVEVKPGGELKWALNANTVLDVTANTDFAQADADVQVNNISRFSVLFPERRQFFLENASLFGSGLMPGDGIGGKMVILPFFSRQIGLNNGLPVPIDGGARLVHRSLKSNYGAMYMRQVESAHSPQTSYFAGRYAHNLGRQNRVGGLLTAKWAGETPSAMAYVNMVGAVDGFFRLSNASTLQAMLMNSKNTNASSDGYAGYVQYNYTSNSVEAWWTQSVLTRHFNPEMGFVSRSNVIATTPGFVANLRGDWIPFARTIRALKPGVALELYHDATSKNLIEREIKLSPLSVELQNGGYFTYALAPIYQNLLSEFSPLGVTISAGSYQFVRHVFSAGSDASRKISVESNVELGGYFDGGLTTLDVNVNMAPVPNVAVKVGANHNKFSEIGEFSASPAVTLYTAEARLALNPRLQLTGLYQYHTANKLNTYNLRLSWEYKPLSYVYLVLNNRTFASLERESEQTGIFKFTYLRQF